MITLYPDITQELDPFRAILTPNAMEFTRLYGTMVNLFFQLCLCNTGLSSMPSKQLNKNIFIKHIHCAGKSNTITWEKTCFKNTLN